MEMTFSTISAIRNRALVLSIFDIITATTYGHSKSYNKPGRGLKGN